MDKPGVWFSVKILRRVNLHDPPHVAYHHPVGDGHGLGLVMGYKDNGKVKLPLEFLNLKTHGLPKLGIQIGKGLIQKHDLGVGDNGPGQGDTLLLSPGKVGRINLLKPIQAAVVQGLLHPFCNIRLIDLLDFKGKCHVVKYIHMRPHRKGLEHHSQPPLLGRHIQIPGFDRHRSAAEMDFPF